MFLGIILLNTYMQFLIDKSNLPVSESSRDFKRAPINFPLLFIQWDLLITILVGEGFFTFQVIYSFIYLVGEGFFTFQVIYLFIY